MTLLRPETQMDLSLVYSANIGSIKDIQIFDDSIFKPFSTAYKIMPAALSEESVRRIKTLATAILQYVQEYDEKFPQTSNAGTLLKVVRPFVGKSAVIQPGTGQNYAWNPTLSGKWQGSISTPSQIAMLYEMQPATDSKRGVAFADGHVKRVTAAEWAKIKKQSGIK